MTETSSTANAVTRLRDALGAGDRDAVARGLQQLPVAIGLDGSQPRIAVVGERRQLPVFLDMASWQAFGLPGEPLLLPHAKLLPLLEALAHVDDVLVDPALPTALQIPRDDLVQLLSAAPTRAGDTTGFDQDEALAADARAALAAAGLGGTTTAWAVQRRTAEGSTPAIVVADGVEGAVLASIGEALQRAQLPRELELVELDAEWTRTAREGWAAVAVA